MRFPHAIPCALAHLWVLASILASASARQDRLFGDPVYPIRVSWWGFELIDLDRDGIDDAVSAGFTTSPSQWARGASDGSFGEAQDLPASFPYRAYSVGDFDSDGFDELVGSSPSGPGVLFTSPGGGPWTWTPLPISGSTYWTRVGRFDTDSHLDVAVLAYTGPGVSMFVFIGDGAGGFSAPRVTALTAIQFAYGGITVGDIDRDGDDDLVVCGDQGVSMLGWWRNDGAGYVTLAQSMWTQVGHEPALVDLEGDGWLDLVARTHPEELAVFRNVQGVFSAPVAYTSNGPLILEAFFVRASDLDGDGTTEIVTAGLYGASIWDVTPQGTLVFVERFSHFTTMALMCRDLNSDGRIDLAWALGYAEGLAVRLARPGGGWSDAWTHWDAAPSELRDLDQDGTADLVATYGWSLRVRLGLGAGNFAPALLSSFPPSNGPRKYEDLDADGWLDVFEPSGSSVAWARARRTPAGAFEAAQYLPTSDYAFDVAALDWDGDGRLDFASTNWPQTLTVHSRLPNGDFGPPTSVSLGFEPRRMLAADFDGDGTRELAISDVAGVLWIVEPPAGGGAPQWSPAFDDHTTRFELVRREQPAGLGLVVEGGYQGLAAWFPDASGAWTRNWLAPTQALSGIGRMSDVDADGHEDLVAIAGGEAVAVLRGDGFGGFGPPQVHGSFYPISSVSVGDLDGDERSDLVIPMPTATGGTTRVLSQDHDRPGLYCAGAGGGGTCVPELDVVGQPAMSGSARTLVRVTSLPGASRVVVFCGSGGPATPLAGGTLCVAPPRVRLPSLRTNPSAQPGTCGESLDIDFGRWLRTFADPTLGAGSHVVIQCWIEEPWSGARVLSDAFDFTVLP